MEADMLPKTGKPLPTLDARLHLADLVHAQDMSRNGT